MMTQDSWFIEVFKDRVGASSFHVDEVLFEGTSRFQRVKVVKNSFLGNVMLLDDLVMLTDKDEFFYHDMLVHVPMACIDNPEGALVIGGGDGGSVREMLKHPSVQRVVLCEIDALVIDTARRFFPALSSCLDDPRVEVVTADGIEYAKAHRNEFDCVCIDSTDPIGPAAGLFSVEFYDSVRDALTEKGAMSAQTESPAWSAELVSSIVRNMKKSFGNAYPYLVPVPCYPSGLWSCTVCFGQDRNPARDFDEERAALLAKTCKYYNADIHRAGFALPNFLRQAL
jgi:spermidine synthase